MVIEYIGSIIRNEVANRREQIYEKQVSLCLIFFRCTLVLSCVCLSSWYDFFHPHEMKPEYCYEFCFWYENCR